jgi:NitT/TauT family transport system permease protein
MVFHRVVPAAVGRSYVPNLFDLAALVLALGVLVLIAHGVQETNEPLAVLDAAPISLDPWNLPDYALRTTLRMLAAIV